MKKYGKKKLENMDGEPSSLHFECEVLQDCNLFFKVRGVHLQADLVCGLPYCEVILEMASSIEGSCHIRSASAIAKGFQTNAGKRKFNKLLL